MVVKILDCGVPSAYGSRVPPPRAAGVTWLSLGRIFHSRPVTQVVMSETRVLYALNAGRAVGTRRWRYPPWCTGLVASLPIKKLKSAVSGRDPGNVPAFGSSKCR
jgi:hypothetical protein